MINFTTGTPGLKQQLTILRKADDDVIFNDVLIQQLTILRNAAVDIIVIQPRHLTTIHDREKGRCWRHCSLNTTSDNNSPSCSRSVSQAFSSLMSMAMLSRSEVRVLLSSFSLSLPELWPLSACLDCALSACDLLLLARLIVCKKGCQVLVINAADFFLFKLSRVHKNNSNTSMCSNFSVFFKPFSKNWDWRILSVFLVCIF